MHVREHIFMGIWMDEGHLYVARGGGGVREISFLLEFQGYPLTHVNFFSLPPSLKGPYKKKVLEKL